MNRQAEKLADLAQKLEHWMRQNAWPLWWTADRHANGAFYEALDFSGRPVQSRIARVRVQARQIYSFALAHKLGWRKEGLESGLEESICRFLKTCLGPHGIPGMLVDIEKGEMTDPQPNLYVTAFTLIALTTANEVSGGEKYGDRLNHLLDDIDSHLAYPDGEGYRETLPATSTRLQNPHMHFFESILCLYQSTRDPAARERAETLLDFVRRTFFDDRHGIVRERVNPDQEAAVNHYEPGHSMEWVWLLGWRSRLFDVPLDPFATRLYEHYCSAGILEGKTPMGLTADHKPVDPTCRLWSQTESLKAHLTMAEMGPPKLRQAAAHRAVECADAILKNWLNTDCRGGWHDHFDADGALIAKDMPGSMGYHLYVAIMELKRVAGDQRHILGFF